MAHRIEIRTKIPDTRAEVLKRKLQHHHSPTVRNVHLIDVYTLDVPLNDETLTQLAERLSNPITQTATTQRLPPHEPFDWAVEIGYLPKITDNPGNTAKQILEDLLHHQLPPSHDVHTSQLFLISGNLTKKDTQRIAETLGYNPLINRVHTKKFTEYCRDNGMDPVIPTMHLDHKPTADIVDILNANDDDLTHLGKHGIPDTDGSHRGPLALDLTYLKTIQAHFTKKGRNPTDVELESIAQTWSEHCKHTIFADPLDDITEGIFRRYIKGATETIRKAKGNNDFCVSVFKDNAGAIIFDENFLITDKVETHNTPSALDPFGGSITGIVGVDRDAIGFGLGAKPVAHRYGFCLGHPRDRRVLYRDEQKTQKTLGTRRILEGVVHGVNVGSNCSGIPTTQGFLNIDERYRGKPLVFVGTIGLIPRETAGRPSHHKAAHPGNYIVMIGGRVGKDGIHGATFSSEALDQESPPTAVQIGDPITQKKLSDALTKEARDLALYTSITDNGAGGLSCSVAEMARESGGCHVHLDHVPVKYAGLKPWEIWISESQERMTLAVPKEHWDTFSNLMKRRGVEATIIGEFTNTGRCVVQYHHHTLMDVELDFLHDGLPPRPMKTTTTEPRHEEPLLPPPEDLTDHLHAMLERPNMASFAFISAQYDHEVQGGSVLKPLQGRGRVNADTTILRPVLSSKKGIVLSHGINPSYSDIDTYFMAACAIDTAVRNAIAAGANPERIALLDNFCWCSSNEPERLGQLKDAAAACYDYATAYGTPFISGKDSMFNDFKGYDENGKPTKISIPPTLLISALGIIDDATKAVSLDAKIPGDFLYLLGETRNDLGGSEYYAMIGEHHRGHRYIGNNVPTVAAHKNHTLYRALAHCIDRELVASAQSVHRGGLATALAKTAMGGALGLEAALHNLPGITTRDDYALFSESQGRILVTIAPHAAAEFEHHMRGNPLARIGTITEEPSFTIKGKNEKTIIHTHTDALLRSYHSPFAGY